MNCRTCIFAHKLFFKSLRPKQGMLNMADKSHFLRAENQFKVFNGLVCIWDLVLSKVNRFSRLLKWRQSNEEIPNIYKGFPSWTLVCIYAHERSWVPTTKQGRNDLLLQFSLLGHSIIYITRVADFFFFF